MNDQADKKRPGPLMRIIGKVLTAYLVVTYVVSAIIMFLFFKFVIGWSTLSSVGLIVGFVALSWLYGKYGPEEEPSWFDVFD